MMQTRHMTTRSRRDCSGAGFTLLEVMFSILILGVGLIAIASIFPVAGHMQRKTFDVMMSQQVADNAKSMLQSRGLRGADMLSGRTYSSVNSLPDQILNDRVGDAASGSRGLEWPLVDRSFPTTVANPLLRSYFWVPVGLRQSNGEWRIFLFILRRENGVVYERFDRNAANWANYNDGKATNDPNLWHVPGVYKFASSFARTDTTTDPNQPLSVLSIRNHGGAVQLGTLLLTDDGRVVTVRRVFRDDITLASDLRGPTGANPTINFVWTGIAPLTRSGSPPLIDRANPVIDIVAVGSEVVR